MRLRGVASAGRAGRRAERAGGSGAKDIERETAGGEKDSRRAACRLSRVPGVSGFPPGVPVGCLSLL